MTAYHRNDLLPRVFCPDCRGVAHRSGSKNGTERCRCNGCRTYFPITLAIVERKQEGKRSGSGKVAVRIEIGRGAKWGTRIGGSLV